MRESVLDSEQFENSSHWGIRQHQLSIKSVDLAREFIQKLLLLVKSSTDLEVLALKTLELDFNFIFEKVDLRNALLNIGFYLFEIFIDSFRANAGAHGGLMMLSRFCIVLGKSRSSSSRVRSWASCAQKATATIQLLEFRPELCDGLSHLCQLLCCSFELFVFYIPSDYCLVFARRLAIASNCFCWCWSSFAHLKSSPDFWHLLFQVPDSFSKRLQVKAGTTAPSFYLGARSPCFVCIFSCSKSSSSFATSAWWRGLSLGCTASVSVSSTSRTNNLDSW